MRAGSFLAVLVVVAAIAAAGLMTVYVPLRLFELSAEGKLHIVAAGVFSALSVIAGAVVAFFTVVIGVPLVTIFRGYDEVKGFSLRRRELEQRLDAYRARQRAMLEELDEIRKLLEEIRDILREGVAG